MLGNRTYLGRMGELDGAHEAVVAKDVFERARAAIESRRTRRPKRRMRLDVDPFILRGLLHCAQCGGRMTTSSSHRIVARGSRRRAPKQPPRYYRCRRGVCGGSQVSAEYIEKRVIDWMRAKRSRLSRTAALVLQAYAPEWKKASIASRAPLLSQLVWEIRWHGPRRRFYVTVDEVAVEQELARLEAPAETDEAAGV